MSYPQQPQGPYPHGRAVPPQQQGGYQLNTSSYQAQGGFDPARAQKAGSGAGWTSIVLAAVVIVVSPVVSYLAPAILSGTGGMADYQLFTYVRTGLVVVVSIVGVVLSAVALQRGRRALGGIGLGVHGAALVQEVWWLLVSAVVGPLL